MDEIISILGTVGLPGALLGTAFFLYKAGVFHKLAGRGLGSSDESGKRLAELESFKLDAETNHFTDIQEVKDGLKDIYGVVRELTEKVSNQGERISKIEGRMNGTHKP